MNNSRPQLPRETQRLVLRSVSMEFAGVMQEAIDETFEDLHPWMPWSVESQSFGETKEFLAAAERRVLNGEDSEVVAFLRAGGEFALGCGLHPTDWSVPKFEIGYPCRR